MSRSNRTTDPEVVLSELRLSPDERLNVAYDPFYTASEEVRTRWLEDLVRRTEGGQRARCPRCDQAAVKFFLLRTGVGVFAIGQCENCGAWTLL
jgi:hypothetical protein